MIPIDDPTALSRLFHVNSEPWLNETAYRGSGYVQEFKEHREAPRTALPPPRPSRIAGVAAQRTSVRAFLPVSMSTAEVSTLLHAAYGVVEVAALEGGGAFLRRSVPSAGGLYPLELYPMLRRVEGVAEGVHHFDARGAGLELVRPGEWGAAAAEVFYTWPFVAEANLIVCFAAVFDRCQKKYGPRGYRYVLLEAGHAAQNLCLAAEELGLATLCMGGFRDRALNTLLGLDVPREGVVYTVAVGRRAR
jgi:SagB-type dehydrogenase family enzyme